jgi:hypothetical protein
MSFRVGNTYPSVSLPVPAWTEHAWSDHVILLKCDIQMICKTHVQRTSLMQGNERRVQHCHFCLCLSTCPPLTFDLSYQFYKPDMKWLYWNLHVFVISTPYRQECLVGLVYSCCSHLEHRSSVKRFVSLQFLNLSHSVVLLGRMISPSQGRYLTKTQNKHNQTSMPRVGFEPTIPSFEWAKTIHALDRAAAVIGNRQEYQELKLIKCPN